MSSQKSPPPSSSSKPKFSVYQNPKFSAALTARSLQPSASAFLFFFAAAAATAASLFLLTSREKQFVYNLTQIHVSHAGAVLIAKCVQALFTLVLVLLVSAFVRALSLCNKKKAVPKEKDGLLTQRQLGLLGLKPKLAESAEAEQSKRPPKTKPVTPKPAAEMLVPIRKSGFSSTPSRPSRIGSDRQSGSSGKRTVMSPVSASPTHAPQYATASPSSPWLRQSSGSAKGILTEAMLEQYLANVDEKITESATKSATTTPQPTIRGFGIASPGSVTSSTTASGATISTPLRPIRMSPGSHQKYSTTPKKGEGELPLPMSMEHAVEAFESLGVYPQIKQWEDKIRQWFSSVLMNPLLDKIETSHIQVMQTAAAVGISITVTQVGSDPVSTTVPVNVSPIDGSQEWQPAVTVDEDGLLYQLHAKLIQARDGSMSIEAQSPLAGQQQLQNPLLPLIQQCVDAITEHQRLNTLMKGELVKGFLPHSSVRADYTVQRVRELAEGTCLKNYDYKGTGDGYDKAEKKWTSELPSDSHLLLYLFCAFLEHPKWMLHVDPTSYSGSQSSKNPLFLGILPPKDRFPEKYVAVISGVPYVIHPGACILSVGKQSPPIFVLYWDKKLQFSLQGRTALWDALLLLCHRIKIGYGGMGELSLSYYTNSCPRAEEIVKQEVEKLYHKHGNTAVSWVRNLFHDCMVKSCDASLLLETTNTMVSEQTSQRSFGMRNFKYINTIKDALEAECPATVSCADVVALSAREGVVLLGGPYILMRTGRRDSRESFFKVVEDFIPNHNDSLSLVLSRFQSVGIDTEGIVALLGAHSVGRVHCTNLVNRLYPTVDPTIDQEYAEYLKRRCPHPNPDPKAVEYARNDNETPMVIDNMYYKNLLSHKGLLLVDQQLVSHPSTAPFVTTMAANNSYFHEKFANSLLLLSENNPLTGDKGEVRKDCRFVNEE